MKQHCQRYLQTSENGDGGDEGDGEDDEGEGSDGNGNDREGSERVIRYDQ